ncbi:hypothetical protein M758_8G068100 [Ceratodon purpureus]|nr:hypothetical protein M758_8G068100 [Ceratodon purpureus]
MKRRDLSFGDGVAQEKEAGVKVLELVMAWLSPQELASLARTCQSMATTVRSLTRDRVADAAQGLERWPVLIRNELDSCRYPWFQYTPSCCRSSSNFVRPWGGGFGFCEEHGGVMRRCQEDLGIFPLSGILSSVGCRCADSCVLAQQDHGELDDENVGCTCGYTSDRVNAYTDEFKLQLLYQHNDGADVCWDDSKCTDEVDHSAENAVVQRPDHEFFEVSDEDSDVNEGPPLILECGGACSCRADCCLRVTQQGLSVRVIVVRQRFTGWGLHAAQHISKGSFVCEYGGELITTAQSRDRQRLYDEKDGSKFRCGSALLVVREYMPSGDACVRINVDATRVGNVARFINHACDGGNLLPCLVRAAGSVIPRLVLFARQDIHDGEELRYSYGSCGGVAGKVLPCHCGTPACFGTLPSDST